MANTPDETRALIRHYCNMLSQCCASGSTNKAAMLDMTKQIKKLVEDLPEEPS